MLDVFHLIAGARGSSRLVQDERDRFELLERLVAALGETLLAYCIMDTHLHVLAEGAPARGLWGEGLRRYARAYNSRHRSEGPLLRGPVEAIRVGSSVELGRALRYVHENPLKTRVPLVAAAIDFEWSSARAYVGLCRAPFPNVGRALDLLGEHAHRSLPPRLALAGLEPAAVAGATPPWILAASAQALGVDPARVAGGGRAPAVVAARAVYVRLGRLEGFRDGQLAPVLGKTRSCVTKVAASEEVDLEAVRVARTLLRRPELRARLHPPAVFPVAGTRTPSRA